MKITQNIVKGLITSAIGLATMIVTLFLVFTGSMDFVWSGIAGLSIGAVLLLAPDTIVKSFGKMLGKFTGKGQIISPDDSTDTKPPLD